MKRAFIFIALLTLLIIAGCATRPPIGPVGSAHIHADFKAYVDGQPLDFAKREYMVKAPFVHIESMDGNTIHIHATGVIIDDFFRTLGMRLTNECFKHPDGKYCTNEGKTLKFYVNGEPDESYGNYVMRDLDKILISYGDETPDELAQQLTTIAE